MFNSSGNAFIEMGLRTGRGILLSCHNGSQNMVRYSSYTYRVESSFDYSTVGNVMPTKMLAGTVIHEQDPTQRFKPPQ